jgi:hypothetical protein
MLVCQDGFYSKAVVNIAHEMAKNCLSGCSSLNLTYQSDKTSK